MDVPRSRGAHMTRCLLMGGASVESQSDQQQDFLIYASSGLVASGLVASCLHPSHACASLLLHSSVVRLARGVDFGEAVLRWLR